MTNASIESLNAKLEQYFPKGKRRRQCDFDAKTMAVKPCWCLSAAIEGLNYEKRKGLMQYQLINIKTGKTTQSQIGVRSGFFKDGIMLNYCPFCGKPINEHKT